MVVSLAASVRAYRPEIGFSNSAGLKRRGTVKKYEAISKKLIQQGRISDAKIRCTPSKLAKTIESFRQYIDRHFGRDSSFSSASSSSKKNSNNKEKISFTIWPISIFHDFSPSGSLYTVLSSLFSFVKKLGIHSFDFLTDDSIHNIQFRLVEHIQNNLLKANYLVKKSIYLAKSVPDQVQEKLIPIVKLHNANLVHSVEQATHVIYNDPPGAIESKTDGQIILRILDSSQPNFLSRKRKNYKIETTDSGSDSDHNDSDSSNADEDHYTNDECLVHWYYHPDSYNHWLPRNEVIGQLHQPKKRPKNHQWHIHARWLRDLHLFNEWMNEEDYEMPDSFSEFEHITSQQYDKPPSCIPKEPIIPARLRLKGNSADQLRASSGNFNSVDTPGNNDLDAKRKEKKARGSLQSTNNNDKKDISAITHIPAINDVNNSNNKNSNINSNERLMNNNTSINLGSNNTNNAYNNSYASNKNQNSADTDDDDDKPIIALRNTNHTNDQEVKNQNKQEIELIHISDNIYMPKFSSWFNLDTTHEIEKRALPEYFSEEVPSKTPKIYREVRNFMIETWRKAMINDPNPENADTNKLTGTNARKKLSGDSCSILRIHAFLEHWGLINYYNKPSSSSSKITNVTSSTPKSLIRPLPTNAGLSDDVSVRKSVHLILDDGSKVNVEENGKINNFNALNDYSNGNARRTSDANISLSRDLLSNYANSLNDKYKSKNKVQVEYHCDSCGADCSDLRYHCITKVDIDLCSNCYFHNKYSSTMNSSDFIQMLSTSSAAVAAAASPSPNDENGDQHDIDDNDHDTDIWTENETLLLLEALEMYSDNWELIAEHVGSKGKGQCVKQFLRLPVEDAFLKSSTKNWWLSHPNSNASLPSPYDIIKSCGQREATIATIVAKGNTSKIFSGQHVVFGDQISTIVPYTEMLSSLCAPEMVDEMIQEMGLKSLRVNNSFNIILNHFAEKLINGKPLNTEEKQDDSEKYDDGDVEMKSNDDENKHKIEETKEIIKQILENNVYQTMTKKIKTPSQVVQGEIGKAVVKASLNLLTDGWIEEETAENMKVADSESDMIRDIQHHINPTLQEEEEEEEEENWGYEDEDYETEDQMDEDLDPGSKDQTKVNNTEIEDVDEKMEKDESNVRRIKMSRQKVEQLSSTAVAMTSLCCACVSAGQWATLENLEVDRLREVVMEMKLDIIRRKMAQLEEVLDGEKMLKRQMKRRREEDLCTRAIRRQKFMMEDGDEVTANNGQNQGGDTEIIDAEATTTNGSSSPSKQIPRRKRSYGVITPASAPSEDKKEHVGGLFVDDENNNNQDDKTEKDDENTTKKGTIIRKEVVMTTFTVAEDLTSRLDESAVKLPDFSNEIAVAGLSENGEPIDPSQHQQILKQQQHVQQQQQQQGEQSQPPTGNTVNKEPVDGEGQKKDDAHEASAMTDVNEPVSGTAAAAAAATEVTCATGSAATNVTTNDATIITASAMTDAIAVAAAEATGNAVAESVGDDTAAKIKDEIIPKEAEDETENKMETTSEQKTDGDRVHGGSNNSPL